MTRDPIYLSDVCSLLSIPLLAVDYVRVRSSCDNGKKKAENAEGILPMRLGFSVSPPTINTGTSTSSINSRAPRTHSSSIRVCMARIMYMTALLLLLLVTLQRLMIPGTGSTFWPACFSLILPTCKPRRGRSSVTADRSSVSLNSCCCYHCCC